MWKCKFNIYKRHSYAACNLILNSIAASIFGRSWLEEILGIGTAGPSDDLITLI